MTMHERRNIGSGVTAAGAILLLMGGLGLLLYSLGVFGRSIPQTSDKFYFYDMQTRQLFAAKASLIPPIEAPSGAEGVLAQVYACGSGEPFILVLQKYSPAAKQAIEAGMPPHPAGHLVCLPEPGSPWVPADSPQGRQLRLQAIAAARARCPDGEPTPRFPQ